MLVHMLLNQVYRRTIRQSDSLNVVDLLAYLLFRHRFLKQQSER
ncbi:MAG TPA: hypothetical protein P5546_05260 [Bacilli bacterium]|nr:hypothetical protein [Bacilli bacterium]